MNAKTLLDILRIRAQKQANLRAFRFLLEGEADGPAQDLTYGGLEQRARVIGASLQNKLRSLGADERALLLYPPGLEFVAAFFGCLFGGLIAVPAYPPSPPRLKQSLLTLRAIVRDCEPRLVLTTSAIEELAKGLFSEAPELAALRWLATDTLEDELAKEWRAPLISGDKAAFLQYTSGSTRAPRGVIVSHQNLLANTKEIHRLAEHHPGSVYVCWLPAYHDMGLIGGVVQPVYGGLLGVLLSPLAFLQRPVRWLQAISKYRGTTSPFPNFALDLCVRKTSPKDIPGLDLRSWRLACNGAEPIREESLARFSSVFAPAGFSPNAHYPAYGLAEATLIASGGKRGSPPRTLSVDKEALHRGQILPPAKGAPQKTLVGCGQPLKGHEIAIVSPETRVRCKDSQIGEIWLKGPSVARGYWNRPEETRESFGAYLSDNKEGPFLRSGDLGFLRDGELYITGRQKDLIILRGKNHYPQDIELTVERCHPGIRPGCAAAFSLEIDGVEELGVAAEVEEGQSPLDLEKISGAIQRALLDDHEIGARRVALLARGSIPKTSSGKIQRYACKEGLLRGVLHTLHHQEAPPRSQEELPTPPHLEAPVLLAEEGLSKGADRGDIEGWLCQLIARRLGVLASAVARDRPFPSLGLDSLQVIELSGDLARLLGREISAAVLYDHPTIEALARYLAGDEMHIVLERPPSEEPARSPVERPLHLLTLSAQSEEELMSQAARFSAFLRTPDTGRLEDICYSAAVGQSHLPHRLAILCTSKEDAAQALSPAKLRKSPRQRLAASGAKVFAGAFCKTPPKIAFLFSGQGKHLTGAGRELFEAYPVFRAALMRCDEILRAFRPTPLLSLLYPETTTDAEEAAALLARTDYAQPTLLALSHALFALWRSFGVTPDVVMGHGLGEISAACAAGFLSIEHALEFAAERGRLMQGVTAPGAMLSCRAAPSLLAPILARRAATLALAAQNGPEQTVLSGSLEDISAAERELAALKVATARLEASRAFHSPLIDPCLSELDLVVAGLDFREPSIPLLSLVTGARLSEEEALTLIHWRRHARMPVRFLDGMRALAQEGCEIFVEIGPGAALLEAGAACLQETRPSSPTECGFLLSARRLGRKARRRASQRVPSGTSHFVTGLNAAGQSAPQAARPSDYLVASLGQGLWLPSLQRDQPWRALLGAVAALYARGASIDWEGFERPYPRQRVPLPTGPV